MKSKKNIVKIIIALILIGFLFGYLVDFEEFIKTLRSLNIPYLLVGIFFLICSVFLSAFRWKYLLSIRNAKMNYFTAVKEYLIGMFFSNFLPSSVGGDVSRMIGATKATGNKEVAVSSVIVERMIGLVALYIEQEILYKEALFMNLDHNDEIIKRRLAQKMEFLSDDLAESLQPTEDMLQEYYKKNKENYAKPSVFTFKQVYFSENKRASAIEDEKIALENEQPENLGDHLYYPTQYTETDALKIATDFGYAFAASLDTLAIGKWSGPVRSGYGIHIVFIENKQPSGFYSYEEVSNRVNVDYNFHASKKFKKELIASLLTNYEISFDLDNRELKEELSERY